MKKLLPVIQLIGNPSFTVGSNYFLTIFAYPHDILKWPKNGLFFFYNPQRLPWQGDVTHINNRPSESYVNNYQEVEFPAPYGYPGNPEDIRSWMKVSAYAYQNRMMIGGLYHSSLGKFYIELEKTSMDMELSAEGVGRAYEDVGGETEYTLIPFKGETNTSRDNYQLKLIYANTFLNNPFGLKFQYREKSSELPRGYLYFTRENKTYNLSHLTWGWATTGCNKIFGYSHINTDAFFQNYYSVLNGHQMDIQLSYEFNGNYKTGIRYRQNRETGDNYEWRYDDGSDFEGNYYENSYWNDKISNDLIRAYSKVRFWRIDNLDAGVLFFFQYASNANRLMNKLTESDPAANQKEQEFVIETNPFINYKFKNGYLDIGILLEVSRTGMKNTYTQWNPNTRSDQKNVLWTTSPYAGWSQYWENFSRGNILFFATGIESYSSIGISKNLSILARLTILKKYSFIRKDYGISEIPEGEDTFTFNQTHERNDLKNETWMTGSIGLSYHWGPITLFGTLQLPLAYRIEQKTELSEYNARLFEHTKKNMWQVQQPTTFDILFVYALGG